MVPASCSLDERGLNQQLERYGTVGAGATLISRREGVLVVAVADGVDVELVGELIATERECCPFYRLEFDSEARRLTVAVDDREHEPALDAIAYALGLSDR